MTIEYDEKGKFYTEVVSKIPTAVVIQTTTHLVRGLVHVRQGERLKDELERLIQDKNTDQNLVLKKEEELRETLIYS